MLRDALGTAALQVNSGHQSLEQDLPEVLTASLMPIVARVALDRQGKLKRRTAVAIGFGPQSSVVCLDDGAADSQPHTHPLRFSGKERLKQFVAWQ